VVVLLGAARTAAQFPVSNLVPPTPTAAPTPRQPVPGEDPAVAAEAAAKAVDARAGTSRKALPAQLASLDVFSGTAHDRLVLYDDGTVSLAETRFGDTRERRRTVTAEERDLVVRVLAETKTVAGDWTPSRAIVDSPGRKRGKVTVTLPGVEPRSFEYDEILSLPLGYGRARGALEDLLFRFRRDEEQGPAPWDPKVLQEGMLLRRRNDGKWFRVFRDDRLSPYLEIVEDAGPRLERMFLTRREVPRVFEAPREARP
jgi:hypothetical protein